MENKTSLTINDVADRAGVSKRTVSRVLNDSPLVGKETRKRIEEVIKELNFQPDKQARGLASKRSYLLGLIYDNPDALYIDQIQRGTLEVCSKLGYELVAHPCRLDNEHFLDECLDFINRSRIDGVLIPPPVSESEALAKLLRKHEHPYVRIGSAELDEHSHTVMTKDRVAMQELAEHLIAFGHRDIAIISGPKTFRSSVERLEGFLSTLKARDIKPKKGRMLEGKNSFESGIQCAKKILAKKPYPTAIFCNNDEMAAGVIRVAYDMGLKIPDDISVSGFDDNLFASRVVPTITTVKRPVEDISALATKKLIRLINGSVGNDDLEWQVTPYLITRESTGPCK